MQKSHLLVGPGWKAWCVCGGGGGHHALKGRGGLSDVCLHLPRCVCGALQGMLTWETFELSRMLKCGAARLPAPCSVLKDPAT